MTITSNIHYNLTPWTNHTFALGERCSNSGHAYQCITSGTSTVAPTGTAADSAPGGTVHFKWLSAIDYTDLQSWHSGIPASLSDHMVAALWNNGEIITAPGVSILETGDGGVAVGAFTITITTAPGESFRDQVNTTPLIYNAANGVAFRMTGASGGGGWTMFYFGLDNIRVEGLQFKVDGPYQQNCLSSNFHNGLIIRNNIIDFVSQSGAGWAVDVSGNVSVYNNLIIDRAASSEVGDLCLFGFEGGIQSFVNNTVVGINSPTGAHALTALQSTTNQVLVRNCALFGYSQPLQSLNAAGAIFVDHCCTNAALFATCTDNGAEQLGKTAANQFVSATTDFRTKAFASCLDAGVTDLVDVLEGNDVFRTARPQNAAWDIGAYELFAASLSTGTAAGVGTAQAVTGNVQSARGQAAGVGTATATTPSTGAAAGQAFGIGIATGIPPILTGVSTLGTIVTIDTTNCISLTPVRLSTTIDPPPYRLRLAYQHNYTVQTSDLNTSTAVPATRIQFLQSPDTYASWSSNLILQRYRRPNDPAPFGGGLLVLAEAQVVVNELGDLFGGRSRLYDAVLPVAVGLAIDLGDPVNLVYPMDDLRNGRYGQVVGEQFRSGDATLTLRILVTTDSRFVAPSAPGILPVV